MTRFTRTGKQVMQGGAHMADAIDETAAMLIVNALCAMSTPDRLARRMGAEFDELREPRTGTDPTECIIMASARNRQPVLTLNDCRKRREGDEWACVCGLRWAHDDDDPPLCIHRSPR